MHILSSVCGFCSTFVHKFSSLFAGFGALQNCCTEFLHEPFVATKSVPEERKLQTLKQNCIRIIILKSACLPLQDIATMQLCANKLDKKDFFGKSDPFLVFYRSNEDGT